MSNKRRSEILLQKVLLRIIDNFDTENPSIRKYLHETILDIYKKKNVSSYQAFSVLLSFYLLLCLS